MYLRNLNDVLQSVDILFDVDEVNLWNFYGMFICVDDLFDCNEMNLWNVDRFLKRLIHLFD